LQNDNSITGASEVAENQFKAQYPIVYNHLYKYKAELSSRNKAETGIRYEWYALQRWGANYRDDFSKQKIIWKIIGNEMAFSIDSNGYIVNNACYILTGPALNYLLSVLNSNIIKWYSYITNMNKTGVGDVQVGGQNLNLFPIPLLPEGEQKPFIKMVGEIITAKENNLDTTILESQMENLVCGLYRLTKEEVAFIQIQ
jgi:adenine-specific DNA-methyltransferase